MSSLRFSRFSAEIMSKVIEQVALSGDPRRVDPLLRQISLVSRDVWDMTQRHLFSHIILTADKSTRKNNARLLKGPRGARYGRHVRCLFLFECTSWIDKARAADLLELIVERAPNISVLHIGYNAGYLDWAALPVDQRNLIVHIMFHAKKIMLEGIENFPLQYFRIFGRVETLDLGHIKLAHVPTQNTWFLVPIPPGGQGLPPIPAPTTLAVHTGIVSAAAWPENINSGENDDTFNTLRGLMTTEMITFSNLTTLYLSSMMKCEAANQLHRAIISQCANTLQELRICVGSSDYSRDVRVGGNRMILVLDCDIIDLSALKSLKSLYIVAVARYPITLLLNLVKTIKLQETYLEELKLIVDENLEGEDWSMDAIEGESEEDPQSWAGLDKAIYSILKAHKDTVVDFMMAPTDTEVDPDDLAEFAREKFPSASKKKRFRFLGLQFRSFAVNELFSTSTYTEDTFDELTTVVVPLRKESHA
ncbi:hypothetical protein APHAL10511_004067 [Amanita phalloides]|nr:hypothetical protein APHAL10511_004067 [Amanita phalloides]